MIPVIVAFLVDNVVYYEIDGFGFSEVEMTRSVPPVAMEQRKGSTREAFLWVSAITAMNESLTVRISRSSHAALRALADETDESMTDILDKAIKAYRRASFLAGLNGDFAALRQNRAAWEAEQQERRVWDATLVDGLED